MRRWERVGITSVRWLDAVEATSSDEEGDIGAGVVQW